MTSGDKHGSGGELRRIVRINEEIRQGAIYCDVERLIHWFSRPESRVPAGRWQ